MRRVWLVKLNKGDYMLPDFLSSLVKEGMTELGEELFDSILGKGTSLVKDKIREVTGLDVDFDSPATSEEKVVFRRDKVEISNALSELMESNRHEEKMLVLDDDFFSGEVTDVKSARKIHKLMVHTGDIFNKHFLEGFTIIILAVMFTIIYMTIFGHVPEGMRSDATGLLEFSKNTITATIGFWFGRLHSKRNKRQ